MYYVANETRHLVSGPHETRRQAVEQGTKLLEAEPRDAEVRIMFRDGMLSTALTTELTLRKEHGKVVRCTQLGHGMYTRTKFMGSVDVLDWDTGGLVVLDVHKDPSTGGFVAVDRSFLDGVNEQIPSPFSDGEVLILRRHGEHD